MTIVVGNSTRPIRFCRMQFQRLSKDHLYANALLKLVPAIFYQIFLFHQMIALQKL